MPVGVDCSIRPGPVPRSTRGGTSRETMITIATATAIRPMITSTGSEWRIRNGSRRRARAGRVRMTAVASPVDVPWRAASSARASSRSAISDGTSA